MLLVTCYLSRVARGLCGWVLNKISLSQQSHRSTDAFFASQIALPALSFGDYDRLFWRVHAFTTGPQRHINTGLHEPRDLRTTLFAFLGSSLLRPLPCAFRSLPQSVPRRVSWVCVRVALAVRAKHTWAPFIHASIFFAGCTNALYDLLVCVGLL